MCATVEEVVAALVRAMGLLVLGPCLGLLVTLLRQEPLVLTGASPSAACEAETIAETLSAGRVAELAGTSRALFVDVRSPQWFTLGHIPGALHLPCAGGDIEAALPSLGHADILLVYGHGTDDAAPVANGLLTRGWPSHVLEGGYDAWVSAGLECASGPCALCEGQHESSYSEESEAGDHAPSNGGSSVDG